MANVCWLFLHRRVHTAFLTTRGDTAARSKKGGEITTITTLPHTGLIGLLSTGPLRGPAELPESRHCQVVWEWCPLTDSRKRTSMATSQR